MENNIFGKTLRIERIKKGLTSIETARLLNISRSYYSDMECGRTLPSAKMLAKLDSTFKDANIFEVYKKAIQK